MTPPPDPSELASALVDGLLTGDEAERAAADPEVAARVEELRGLQRAIREVPRPQDFARANALAAAVDAGMDAYRQPDRPVAQQRDRRPWLAAAAIVAVVALAVGVLSQRNDDDTEVTAPAESGDAAEDQATFDDDRTSDEAAGAEEAEEAAPEAADDADGAETQDDLGPPDADQPGSGTSMVDLGMVPDEEELAARVTTRADPSEPVARPSQSPLEERNETAGAAEGCPQRSETGDSRRGVSTFAATAVLAGEPVWVHLYPEPEDRARLIATNRDCVDVVDRVVNAGS